RPQYSLQPDRIPASGRAAAVDSRSADAAALARCQDARLRQQAAPGPRTGRTARLSAAHGGSQGRAPGSQVARSARQWLLPRHGVRGGEVAAPGRVAIRPVRCNVPSVRPAAVAGMFYPGTPAVLGAAVRAYLAEAQAAKSPAGLPKALL